MHLNDLLDSFLRRYEHTKIHYWYMLFFFTFVVESTTFAASVIRGAAGVPDKRLPFGEVEIIREQIRETGSLTDSRLIFQMLLLFVCYRLSIPLNIPFSYSAIYHVRRSESTRLFVQALNLTFICIAEIKLTWNIYAEWVKKDSTSIFIRATFKGCLRNTRGTFPSERSILLG